MIKDYPVHEHDYFGSGSRDGQIISPDSLREGIDVLIASNVIIKEMFQDIKDIKNHIKILDKPSPEILEQYNTLRDLYDQYRETHILIFGGEHDK